MEQAENPISNFELNGINRPVSFVKRMDVTEGVVCDVYSFVDDQRMDLGVIRIDQGKKLHNRKFY